MILTQKETMLLQDLKTQEQVCIEKYNQYAERANDPKLSQLLRTISSAEQQHLSTLEQTVCWQSGTSGSPMICGSWTMTMCTATFSRLS